MKQVKFDEGRIVLSEEYIPAIITASVALFAAVLAQFIGHILNKKRQDNIFNMEVYQNFIAPYLSDVFLYYETETNFRKGHDVEKNINIEGLIDRISMQKQYGDVKLLQCFFDMKVPEYFFDGRGGTKKRSIIYLIFWYLDSDGW